jgi:hypothetical protein
LFWNGLWSPFLALEWIFMVPWFVVLFLFNCFFKILLVFSF